MKPSVKARLELLESGKKKISFEGNIYPKETPTDTKGYKDFKILCKNCGERLGYFKSKKGKLTNGNDDFYGLKYTSWYDKESWHGCLGANTNKDTLDINFECCCGERTIEERYTSIKIVKDGNNK